MFHEVPTSPAPAADSWTRALPILVTQFIEGDEQTKAVAGSELKRMADLADKFQDAVSIVLVPKA